MEDKKIDINISAEIAEGKYSNLAIVAHSENEFVIDFINYMPQMPEAKVVSRIIMSPESMKKLIGALMDNMRKYEQSTDKGGVSLNDATIIYNGPKGEA